MTDYKQLRGALEQAAHELDFAKNALLCSSYHNAAQRAKQAAHAARAALAEPEPEGPTDEELLEVLDRATADFPPNHPEAEPMTPARYALTLELRKARAAIAADRAQRQPVPPEPGEVQELVEWLLEEADDYDCIGETLAPPKCRRAAELLSQRYPQPVPVSERLPGAEDCDGEGRCWWGFEETDDYEASWTLRKMIGLPFDDTHWLPATALPLPQGEVQP